MTPALKPTVYAFALVLAIVIATTVIVIADKAADVPSWFEQLAILAGGGGLVAIPTAANLAPLGGANAPAPVPAPLPPPAPAPPVPPAV